jgi:hypothetical protein
MKTLGTFTSTVFVTAVWMSASRLGPTIASIAAAASLPSADYGFYVVAIAWFGGLVSVISGASQAFVARAKEASSGLDQSNLDKLNSKLTAEVLNWSRMVVGSVPLCIGIALYSSGFSNNIIAMVALAGFFSAMNSVFSALLWGRGCLYTLAGLACLESALMILAVAIGGQMTGDLAGATYGLAGASILASLAYCVAIVLKIDRESLSARIKTEQNHFQILTPNLLNGVAGVVGPSLALSVCINRDPTSLPLYGLTMVFIALLLFPLQILGVAIAQPLIAKQTAEKVELGRNSLLVGLFFGLAIALCIFLVGPYAVQVFPFKSIMNGETPIHEVLLLTSLIYFLFSIVVTAGPIVQANGQYWGWAFLNCVCAMVFVCAAWLLPLGPTLIFEACLISAALRAVIGFPLASRVVQKWSR